MTSLNEEICDLYRLAMLEGDTLGRFSREVKRVIKEQKNKKVK